MKHEQGYLMNIRKRLKQRVKPLTERQRNRRRCVEFSCMLRRVLGKRWTVPFSGYHPWVVCEAEVHE